jgi:hypothetical protein
MEKTMTSLRDRSKHQGATWSCPERPKKFTRFGSCIEARQLLGRAPICRTRLTSNLEAEYAWCDPKQTDAKRK